MAAVSVNVDIDLDDIDTDDLVEEMCKRLQFDKNRYRKGLTTEERKKLREKYTELGEALQITTPEMPEIESLEDQMKYQHLLQVWKKYSSAQFESRLPA